MKTAERLLSDLDARGISLELTGEKLRVWPMDALTADLRARVVAARPDLVRLLGAPKASPSAAPVRFDGQSVGMREVLGLRADLLAHLPLASSLIVLPDRRAIRSDSARWSQLVKAGPTGGNVAAVLAHHGLQLLAVMLDGATP